MNINIKTWLIVFSSMSLLGISNAQSIPLSLQDSHIAIVSDSGSPTIQSHSEVKSQETINEMQTQKDMKTMNDVKTQGEMKEIRVHESKTTSSMPSTAVADKSILDMINTDPSLTTFVKILKASDVGVTLSGSGPFTIFAPTNEAFAKLPQEKLDMLMKPENKEKLAEFLKSHVISGKLISTELKNSNIQSVNGKQIQIKAVGSDVRVNDARIIKSEIVGSNGVIHVIDMVLLSENLK